MLSLLTRKSPLQNESQVKKVKFDFDTFLKAVLFNVN